MRFEEKLKCLRKERGMTQADLAERLNVSRQAVSKWETGASLPDIENILSICKVFEVTPNDFFTADSEKEEEKVREEPSRQTEPKKEQEQEGGNGENETEEKTPDPKSPFPVKKAMIIVVAAVIILLLIGGKLDVEGIVILYFLTGVIILFIYFGLRFIFRVLSKYRKGGKK